MSGTDAQRAGSRCTNGILILVVLTALAVISTRRASDRLHHHLLAVLGCRLRRVIPASHATVGG